MPDIALDGLVVSYPSDGYEVRPIDGLSASIGDGELALLLGPSGCGKTTLLSVLGGIMGPTSGRVAVDDIVVSELDDGDLLRYRRSVVGFVFQSFNLIRSLSALDNVAAPLLTIGVKRRVARERARDILVRVGLGDRLDHRPAQLSGGQQQRVAVARGLVHDPPLLLADEPTANLDYVQAEAVIELLRQFASSGRTVVVSTHDDRLRPIADTVVDLAPTLDLDQAVGPVQLDKGAVLFRQGTRSNLVYEIEKGKIEIVRSDEDGERVVAVLGAGQYFGELGPMLGQPRTATAQAKTRAVVVAMSLQDFRLRGRYEASQPNV